LISGRNRIKKFKKNFQTQKNFLNFKNFSKKILEKLKFSKKFLKKSGKI